MSLGPFAEFLELCWINYVGFHTHFAFSTGWGLQNFVYFFEAYLG